MFFVNRNKKIAVLTVIAAVLIIIPGLTVSALASPPQNALIPAIFPKGTICGDAQLGSWSTNQWTGDSNYQGLYSKFTLNNFHVSGGNSGTVSASSGSLSVYNKNPNIGGHLIFYATFNMMNGHYSISNTIMHSIMHLTSFFAKHIKVYFNHISGHEKDHRVMAGSYKNAHIPNQTLPCATQDKFLS